MKSISHRLAPETVRVIFKRGRDYFYDERVKPVSANKDKFRTVVAGTKPYLADIKVGPRKIKTSCDCPYSQTGEICKHIIASALFWDTQVRGNIPTDDQIEKLTIDKPAVSNFQGWQKFEQLFKDPLNADLDFWLLRPTSATGFAPTLSSSKFLASQTQTTNRKRTF